MKITSGKRDLIMLHLSNRLDTVIQERHVGLTEYHHGHERQFAFAREKDLEAREIRDLIFELTNLDD